MVGHGLAADNGYIWRDLSMRIDEGSHASKPA